MRGEKTIAEHWRESLENLLKQITAVDPAALEELSQLVLNTVLPDPPTSENLLQNGTKPDDIPAEIDKHVAQELRERLLELSNSALFLALLLAVRNLVPLFPQESLSNKK